MDRWDVGWPASWCAGVHTEIMVEQVADVPVLVIDGAVFSDFEGFAREFSRLLDDHVWRGNLDAFNDILRGGFGTPEGGWVLRWLNSDVSRVVLGHQAMIEWLEDVLLTCHPSNRPQSFESPQGQRGGERGRVGPCAAGHQGHIRLARLFGRKA